MTSISLIAKTWEKVKRILSLDGQALFYVEPLMIVDSRNRCGNRWFRHKRIVGAEKHARRVRQCEK